MKTIKGISVSRGINIGPVYQFHHLDLSFETRQVEDREAEWQRFQDAVKVSKGRLQQMYDRAVKEIGTDEAMIFDAHMMMLEDPDLIDGTMSGIMDEGLNAEAALLAVCEQYCDMLREIEDKYIQARVTDIQDVCNGVIAELLGLGNDAGVRVTEPSVIISRDLTPSDCVSIQKALIEGFCTIEGGTTSHTAILARSLGIPALVGAPDEIEDIPPETIVIIDGYEGVLIIDPDPETIKKYERKREAKLRIIGAALEHAKEPAVTKDGHRVETFVNLGSDSSEDINDAIARGAEGVGLLRTEFIYLNMEKMPDEETQYEKYSNVAKGFGESPVILRTLDIGGDKQLPYLELPYEMNPFLGVRGLRLCLKNPDLFKCQLRAVLRACSHGNLRIMFPMVTKLSEIRRAKELIGECRAELKKEGIEVIPYIHVGIMIEIPGAAIMSDLLAKEVEFFSIGTNDLTQYTLAVDRTNNSLADLANAFDPAVLRLIARVAESAHRYGKTVGVCGELGGDPIAIPILVGLGLDELSMNAPAIPIAKQIIRGLNFEEVKKLAQEVLDLESPADVKAKVFNTLPVIADLS
ncbi:MAG: phosphoenolpyruvate--protein phosphotransferase [Anaerolineaceae bacterium]|nr:phosphoenolpyruvate--protein phosphotransferase [Anaerolineaceae bacterium]